MTSRNLPGSFVNSLIFVQSVPLSDFWMLYLVAFNRSHSTTTEPIVLTSPRSKLNHFCPFVVVLDQRVLRLPSFALFAGKSAVSFPLEAAFAFSARF
ncbi:MAG: hypothetical protein RHS_3675 [Robinsoniella sp. RHS]|nr:MAG: hypothetical protein RHS_3675 [Robinsoniella sp. RHS]